MYGRPEPPDNSEEALRSELLEGYKRGIARYGLQRFSFSAFLQGVLPVLTARLEKSAILPSSRHMLDCLAKVPVEDLVLRLAFELGDREEATDAFITSYSDCIARRFHRLDPKMGDQRVIELTKDLLESLVLGAFTKSASPALLKYDAYATIDRWLAGVVSNNWSNWNRKRGSRRSTLTKLLRNENHAAAEEKGPDQVTHMHYKEVARIILRTLKKTFKGDHFGDRDLAVYCMIVLSRKPQKDLANKLRIDPAQFSRCKKRAMDKIASGVRDCLNGFMAGQEIQFLELSTDPRQAELSKAVRSFARWYYRGWWRQRQEYREDTSE